MIRTGKYKICWKHIPDPIYSDDVHVKREFELNEKSLTQIEDKEGTRIANGLSACRIYDTKLDKEIAEGISITAVMDSFNKETGRKIALKRALDNLTANERLTTVEARKRRTMFWEAYRSRK